MDKKGSIFEKNNKKDEKTPEEEGAAEAIKDRIKEQQKSKIKFEELINRSTKEIMKISSFFPFDLFPDVLIVYPDRVNIIFKEFFFSKQIITVLIKNIKDIVVETSILFATIKITIDGYEQNPVTIRFLKRGEAIKTRRMIQGLASLDKAGIDILKIKAELGAEEFLKKVEELGQAEGKEETGAI